MTLKEEALKFHSMGRKGKIEVISTKPCSTSKDLSLAYSPGVAEPCLEIEKNPSDAYLYTAKGNLVGVVSNGTAVLGLGDIGALAGKPVMEGKGILFKKFADIDVFDIEVNEKDPKKFCQVVKALEPTFGGINLEDIKAPECFFIEKYLKENMNIPVFHDDQHGTAIILGAALLNALEVVNKKIDEIKVVFSGAGAAGTMCALFINSLGVKDENIFMFDKDGPLNGERKDLAEIQTKFIKYNNYKNLREALINADVFIGLSAANLLKPDMLKTMNENPIVFAMANPNPEISYNDAIEAREDVIMATGRSDFPNQVNNVLCFPFIFRGALDCQATQITEGMKLAAAKAIAKLAKEEVPDSVIEAYGGNSLKFGRTYIIPKPLDPRVVFYVAPAVVEAAIKDGVARINLNIEEYKNHLEKLLAPEKEVMKYIINKAKNNPKRIVFTEGENVRVLKAVQQIVEENIAFPTLIGSYEKITAIAEENNISLNGIKVIDCLKCNDLTKYTEELYKLRQRKGYTKEEALQKLNSPDYFAMMMLYCGDVDGVVTGETIRYSQAVRPALKIIKLKDNIERACGMYIVVMKDKIKFFADTTVNAKPSAQDLANIAILTADTVKNSFNIIPKVAMLSYSNFGSAEGDSVERVQEATKIVKQKRPDIIIDGEMQVNVALSTELLQREYPFSDLKEEANVLIFPNLSSGNISYKLMNSMGNAKTIGPILLGMKKAVNVLSKNSKVDSIIDLMAITVVQAQGDIL